MTKGTFRKAGVAALSALVALVTFGVSPFAAPAAAQAQQDVPCARIFGQDRYDTAAAIALETFGDTTTPTVLIARGDGTPTNPFGVSFDALSGAYGAGLVEGPILLTPGNGPLPDSTVDAIEDLGATEAVILGGPAAVSPAVEAELEAQLGAANVDRIGGRDRFETAYMIGSLGPVFVNAAGESSIFLASGDDAREGADALAAGPPSYAEQIPILLTQSNSLNSFAAQFIDENDIERVYVLGGTVAVSGNVTSAITPINGGTQFTRIEGAGRQGTAVDLAVDFLIDELGWETDHFNLANGVVSNLIDALAGAPHGGEEEAMTLLTSGRDTLGEDTESFLEDLNDGVLQQHGGDTVEEPESAHILGGPAAINDETVSDACTLAGVPVTTAPGGDAAALSLTPETDINQFGAAHTVVADVDNASGGPAANGQLVRFEVYREFDDSATRSNAEFIVGGFDTATGGTADFTYGAAGTTGAATSAEQDIIVACVVPNQTTSCVSSNASPPQLTRDALSGGFTNINSGVRDTAEKEWTDAEGAATALVLTPETDVNPSSPASGSNHTVTARVTGRNGEAISGAVVKFELFRDTDNDGRFQQVDAETAESSGNGTEAGGAAADLDYDTLTGGTTNLEGGATTPDTRNAAGNATYTFTNAAGPGIYLVVACVDVDNDVNCATISAVVPGQPGPVVLDTGDRANDTARKEFVSPSAAPTGNVTGTVVQDCTASDPGTVGIYTADNRFLILTYSTADNDTFTVNGATATLTGFTTACSPGDTIQSNYNAATGIQSTFALTDGPAPA